MSKSGIRKSSDCIARIRRALQSAARNQLIPFCTLIRPNYHAFWHHSLIASKLEAVARGEITRLIISMPPRHGKSELATRCFLAWYLGRHPDREAVVASYNADKAKEFCRDFKRIVDSEEYREIFPGVTLPTAMDRGWINQADSVEIVGRTGVYRSVGIGGGLTGKGLDIGVIDDPIKNLEEAYSPTYREKVWGWYQSTLRTRQQSDKAGIVVIATRWHQDDLIGRLLRDAAESEYADQWEVINLPAINEHGPALVDHRQIGEALWPERYGVDFLNKLKGGKIWEALYQGQPTSDAGEIVRRDWIGEYTEYPDNLASGKIIQAWDLNFGKTPATLRSSYVCGQCWAQIGAKYYLLDSVRGKWTHTENKIQVVKMRKRWPRCRAVYIEDAASGAPLVDDLKGKIPGLIPVRPQGSKVARFESVAPLFEARQVFAPPPGSRLWVDEWIEEIVSFPGAPNDDQVDTTAMALTRLSGGFDYSRMRLPGGGARESPIRLV